MEWVDSIGYLIERLTSNPEVGVTRLNTLVAIVLGVDVDYGGNIPRRLNANCSVVY